MAAIVAVVRAVYPAHFRKKRAISIEADDFQYNYSSMKASVPIFIGVVVLFFFSHRLGLPIPVIALAGSALILIFGKIKPSQIIKDVDWVLLIFFASLFIVVRGFEKSGLMDFSLLASYLDSPEKGIAAVHGVSLVLSQIVSNVPLVVALLPILTKADSPLLWLGLASASTLAGNATIIGAMANLIVIESARKEGVSISFGEFLKAGIPVTIITLIISMTVLLAESFFLHLK